MEELSVRLRRRHYLTGCVIPLMFVFVLNGAQLPPRRATKRATTPLELGDGVVVVEASAPPPEASQLPTVCAVHSHSSLQIFLFSVIFSPSLKFVSFRHVGEQIWASSLRPLCSPVRPAIRSLRRPSPPDSTSTKRCLTRATPTAPRPTRKQRPG